MSISSRNCPVGYYVYAYIRSKDSKHGKSGTPYYIGKGKGYRAWAKDHNVNLPNRKYIVIISENLTEFGALCIERRLIRWYGQIHNNTGILRNISDGGDMIPSRKGLTCYNNGIIEKWSTVFVEGWNKGRLSVSKKSFKPRKPNSGYRTVFWWNNGIVNVRAAECPGDEFSRGRCQHGLNAKQVGKYYNNGIIQIRSIETPIGDNWVAGKLASKLESSNQKLRESITGNKIYNNGIVNKRMKTPPTGTEWKLGFLKK